MHKSAHQTQDASDTSQLAARPDQPIPTDRYALVTGGGSGIGAEFCQALSDRGWTVAVSDLSVERAAETCASLAKTSRSSVSQALDVTSEAAWQEVKQRLRGEWPRLDLVVNNAGILVGGNLHQTDPCVLSQLMATNVTGTLLGCHTMTDWLIESTDNATPQRRGDPRRGIINVASIFAALSPPGFAAYSASKAAVVALSESLHGELAPHGLNVTVALPGMTETPLFKTGRYTTDRVREATCEYSGRSPMPAELVAEATLKAAASGQLYAVVGRRARWRWRLKGLLPKQMIGRVAADARRVLGVG